MPPLSHADAVTLAAEVDEEESQEATAEQIATPEEALSAAPSQAEPVQEDAYKTEETPETEESSQAATPAAGVLTFHFCLLPKSLMFFSESHLPR